MPQDTRTATDIINNAFYLIGLVSPDVVPGASLAARGLYVLNNVLDNFSGAALEIPFIQELQFNMSTGKDVYSFSNVIPSDIISERISELEYVNVVIPGGFTPNSNDNIIDPVRTVDWGILLNSRRYTGVAARPSLVTLIRESQQSLLQFYPKPDQAYRIIVRAKFMLGNLKATDTITQIPVWYYDFLSYSVARKLKNYYASVKWTPDMEMEYQEMCENIRRSTTTNVNLQPDGILQSRFSRFAYPYPFGVI